MTVGVLVQSWLHTSPAGTSQVIRVQRFIGRYYFQYSLPSVFFSLSDSLIGCILQNLLGHASMSTVY